VIRDGVRAGLPLALAVAVVGVSFGVLAEPVIGAVPSVAMSILVFAGSAQFAANAVLGAGGTAAAAIAAGILLNLRYVPMGIALAPSLRGGPGRRAAYGQAMVDASWAMAGRGGGRFDADFMLGATLPQYPAWFLGTAAGVLAGGALGDPADLGLDALFPAFFLALLINGELREGPRAVAAAALGAGIALALTPFAPAGLPVIAASAAALIGLIPGRDDRPAEHPEIEGDPVG
jgi:predicted branched-subunit amino acid permease